MVTVKNAFQLTGYSGNDHLLDNRPYQDMIGRSYRDAGAAKRAALNIQKKNYDKRVGSGPIEIVLDVCGEEVIVRT